MIEGAANVVPILGKRLAQSLGNARGGGKGGRFQAKVDPGVFNENVVLDMHRLARQTVVEVRGVN